MPFRLREQERATASVQSWGLYFACWGCQLALLLTVLEPALAICRCSWDLEVFAGCFPQDRAYPQGFTLQQFLLVLFWLQGLLKLFCVIFGFKFPLLKELSHLLLVFVFDCPDWYLTSLLSALPFRMWLLTKDTVCYLSRQIALLPCSGAPSPARSLQDRGRSDACCRSALCTTL